MGMKIKDEGVDRRTSFQFHGIAQWAKIDPPFKINPRDTTMVHTKHPHPRCYFSFFTEERFDRHKFADAES
jgi:hypothetical protein